MKPGQFSAYSKALLSLALEENDVKTYKDDIKEVAKLLDEEKGLLEILSSYRAPHEEVLKSIEEIFSFLKGKSSIPFLKLLYEKHLISHFEDIATEFISLCNDELGIKEGIAYSAAPLSKEKLTKIEKALSNKLGAEVSLENRVEKSLLGGVRVFVDGKVFDASLSGKLESLRNSLLVGGSKQ